MVVDGEVVTTISRALGHGTNNTAEQHAVLAALELARERGIERPRIYTDSQLVVRQVSGEYSTRSELLEMRDRIAAALRELNGTLEWVPRERNTIADALSKRSLLGDASVFPPDTLAEVRVAIASVLIEQAIREFCVFVHAALEERPEEVSERLLGLRLGRSSYSTMPLGSARFSAIALFGETAVAGMEAALADRSPATVLKAVRLGARGLPPGLVVAKLTLEKRKSMPYRWGRV